VPPRYLTFTAALDEREGRIVVAVQRLAEVPGALQTSRALSAFGDHALGWLALGAVAAVADPASRCEWVRGGATVFAAHAASVVIKRAVRRPRPHSDGVEVFAHTPGRFSFPSSHAAAVAAAAAVFGPRPGRLFGRIVLAPMAASRLVLGVHYPTDIAAGAALGYGLGLAARRLPS
jgi:membrane-associated phospholipid phosphatase